MLDEVNAALLEHDPQSTGIRRQQLYNDINFMKSTASNWEAPIVSIRNGQTVYYTYSDPSYSINKRPLHPESATIKSLVLFFPFALQGLPQFSWLEPCKYVWSLNLV